jgi:hypothetical protein
MKERRRTCFCTCVCMMDLCALPSSSVAKWSFSLSPSHLRARASHFKMPLIMCCDIHHHPWGDASAERQAFISKLMFVTFNAKRVSRSFCCCLVIWNFPLVSHWGNFWALIRMSKIWINYWQLLLAPANTVINSFLMQCVLSEKLRQLKVCSFVSFLSEMLKVLSKTWKE